MSTKLSKARNELIKQSPEHEKLINTFTLKQLHDFKVMVKLEEKRRFNETS